MLFAPHGEAGAMQSIARHNQYESLRDHTEAIALLAAIGARIPRTRVFLLPSGKLAGILNWVLGGVLSCFGFQQLLHSQP
jgi:hypothetical protein